MHSIIVHGDFSLASNCFQLTFLYVLSLAFNLTLAEILLDFKINVLKLKSPCKSRTDVLPFHFVLYLRKKNILKDMMVSKLCMTELFFGVNSPY